jgi:hypothetical protein
MLMTFHHGGGHINEQFEERWIRVAPDGVIDSKACAWRQSGSPDHETSEEHRNAFSILPPRGDGKGHVFRAWLGRSRKPNDVDGRLPTP